MSDASISARPIPSGESPTVRSLAGVSRTLLIPLLARAQAHRLWPGVEFDDASARSVAAALEVEQMGIRSDPFPMRLCISRSMAIARVLHELLSEPIKRTLVLLACGLDTLPFRIQASLEPEQLAQLRGWICADLAPVMAVREQLLPATDRVQHACIALPDSLDAVTKALDETRPVFILEGILPYLRREEVARCFSALSAIAPAGADLLVDGYHPALLAFSKFGNTFRRMHAEFHFGIADARTYAKMVPRVRFHEQYDLLRPLPWRYRKRAVLPALAAAGKPLATLARLEIDPDSSQGASPASTGHD